MVYSEGILKEPSKKLNITIIELYLVDNIMSVYYVYILEVAGKNGKKRFYTGYTNNLYRRWNEHRKGIGAKFCRGKRVIELKYFEIHSSRKEAMRRELEIKSYSRQQKRELINTINV